MKQTIEFYYNLKIDELLIENDNYHFIYNGVDYYFIFFNRLNDLDNILKCINELKNYNYPVHEIIQNNMGNFYVNIDEATYVLIKVKNKDEVYEILDINSFNKRLSVNNKNGLYKVNWDSLWSKKIDYIEYQLQEIKTDKIVHSSIDYFIGLGENAIAIVNNAIKKYGLSDDDKIVLSRKRVFYPNYNLNYFNPLTFIFDLEVRDVAEYIKSCFFYGDDALLELTTYLKSNRLTFLSYNMLFARLLYPSYYFDLYDKIVSKKESSEKLIKIIEKTGDYEKFLKKAYQEISLYAPLENVEQFKY